MVEEVSPRRENKKEDSQVRIGRGRLIEGYDGMDGRTDECCTSK